jgi:Ni,Fe-hydrogenase III small subunit/Pyruvate/2-oxoacid:ferredoxin oxidoreductase delta subunit
MLKSIRVRMSQGTQFITDLRKAVPTGFRGLPTIGTAPCPSGCLRCQEACPTNAIALAPVRLDLGKCVFCNECVLVCPEEKIKFTPEPRMGAKSLEALVVAEGGAGPSHVAVSEALRGMFGRSLRLRQVSAGGCNACELELNAIANVNFDLQRYGIEWVASPRHADALVLSGPLTKNMRDAVRLAWGAMPEPRFLVSVGACTISGGLYAGASGVDRAFLSEVGPTLYVPGCPPHPLTFITAVLDLLGIALSEGR